MDRVEAYTSQLLCPLDTAFKQQRLKAWQPILTPRTVLPTLFIVGILFAPIGALLIWGSSLVRLYIPLSTRAASRLTHAFSCTSIDYRD